MLAAAALLSLGLLLLGVLLRQERREEALLMFLLAAAAAGAVLYLPVQRQKEAEEKRREALNRDYSQMVTLLSLYMTAGLTLRSSWEQLVRSDEEDRRRGAKEQPVYEEMLITWRELRGGVYEDRAYGAFGRRCGTPAYLRLGGLLETYVQQGNKELLLLLEQDPDPGELVPVGGGLVPARGASGVAIRIIVLPVNDAVVVDPAVEAVRQDLVLHHKSEALVQRGSIQAG